MFVVVDAPAVCVSTPKRRQSRRTKSEGGGARKQEWAGAGAERVWQMGGLLEQIEAERMGAAVETEAERAARRRSASNKVDIVLSYNIIFYRERNRKNCA